MSDTIQCDIKYDTAESCVRKYKTLVEAQKMHKMNSIDYRLSILNKLLLVWEKYEKEVNKSNFLDMGQSEFTSQLYNFIQVRNEIKYAINNIHDWVKPKSIDTPVAFFNGTSYVKPEPFGICLIFSAWNCNFLTLIIPLVQAIAAGNLVIAKPASSSPETCKVCMKILNELPPEAVQCCAGKPEVYTALLEQRYDLIMFTGSADKGKIIAEAAAKNWTPTIWELGGQNPVVVDKSANIKTAATNIISGRHTFFGQACIAPEYILCDKAIYKDLIEELKVTFSKFYTSNPKTSPDIGRIISKSHAERIYKLIQDPGEGAVFHYGDIKEANIEDKYVPSTLIGFDSLTQLGKSNLAKAEIFGPVLYIAPYDKIEEAVDYINKREKPLAEYIFTDDSTVKEYLINNTSSGGLVVNDCVVHFSSPYIPFGGVGHSGMGHYHGFWGFENMSHWKPVLDMGTMLNPLRYPPYSEKTKSLLNMSMRNYNFGKNQIKNWIIYVLFGVIALLLAVRRWRK